MIADCALPARSQGHRQTVEMAEARDAAFLISPRSELRPTPYRRTSKVQVAIQLKSFAMAVNRKFPIAGLIRLARASCLWIRAAESFPFHAGNLSARLGNPSVNLPSFAAFHASALRQRIVCTRCAVAAARAVEVCARRSEPAVGNSPTYKHPRIRDTKCGRGPGPLAGL